ncbi:MAG: phenylalanine--tRNA ligase subunit beta [Bacteroidia bacterium]|nr:phenylalanine--tRNA ligase subunit beta [Bacteroidia bacterium]
MKISYDWLCQYLPVKLKAEQAAELLTHCGLEVEEVIHYQTVKGGLQGIVIGEVIEKVRHPNADKLSVCKVNINEGELRQIICGAPNVATGQKVVVALPGAVLYPAKGEPFKITKSKIRGEVSEGMICAEDEIGLGSSHEGIMILPTEAVAGMQAAAYFNLKSDYVFEIGLTPNRGDAASHLGVARDLAAVIRNKNPKINHQEVTVKRPEVKLTSIPGNSPVKVTIENNRDCIRYSGILLSGLTITDSPDWLRHRLQSIGLKPVNNVVDITNFVLHEYGQPLHAFDADKISGSHVVVKNLPAGTIFKTLDGIEHKLTGDELMICDEKHGMCLAGVFGGSDSGVTSATKNVFLESACFSPSSIRKTAKHHGLKTDASFRFERGTDPSVTVEAMLRAAALIEAICLAKVSPYYTDIYPNPVPTGSLTLNPDKLNRLMGVEIPESAASSILTDLGFELKSQTKTEWTVSVPTFKSDIRTSADCAEEILRIYGYNNVPLPLKLKIPLPVSAFNASETLLEKVTQFLVANGFTEILNNSLSELSHLPEQVKILNPLSQELAGLRSEMISSGLETIRYNLNRKNFILKLFETGRIYRNHAGKFSEEKCISIFIAGNRLPESRFKTGLSQSDFYTLKSVIINLLEQSGINSSSLQFKLADKTGFGLCAAISCSGNLIGYAGYVSLEKLKQFEIQEQVLAAELYRDAIRLSVKPADSIREPSHYPVVKRDLAFIINDTISYSEIEKIVSETEKKLIRQINLFDIYRGEHIGQGKMSLAVSFYLQDDNKTLTDKQIDGVMDQLMKALTMKLGAEIRK